MSDIFRHYDVIFRIIVNIICSAVVWKKWFFNYIYSRDNPHKAKFNEKIKDGAYIISLDEYCDIGTHWIALYVLNNVTYFDSFGIEQIPKEIKTFIGKKNTKTNIYKHMIR